MEQETVIAPLWDLVKISFGKVVEKTTSGVILPEHLANDNILDIDFYPIVIAVGDHVSPEIKVGDRVLVPISRTVDPQGTDVSLACYAIEIKEQGEMRALIRQTDINGIVTPVANEAS